MSGVVSFGPIEVLGTVTGDIISFGGHVTLAESADVWGNVTAVCADIRQDEGAQVHGEVYANALPDMALIDIEHRGLYYQVFRIGRCELRPGQRNPIAVLVLGGDVFVGEGVRTGEIIAIGGDVIVDPGAEVTKVCAVGGEITRPEGQEADRDEAIPSVVVPCDVQTPAIWGQDAPARGSSSASISHHYRGGSVGLSVYGRGSSGTIIVTRSAGPGLTFRLNAGIDSRRGGRPDARQAGLRWEAPPPKLDPQFESAMYVSADLHLDVTAVSGLVGQPETTVERAIDLGVPGNAPYRQRTPSGSVTFTNP